MNSQAVAGPSSQPYQTTTTTQSKTNQSQQTPTIARSVNGPKIIPTILHADGIKEVPHYFEMCQVDDLIVLIASMLDRLISHNDRIPLTPTSLTRFHSRAPPTINIVDYLTRIERYTNVEAAVLLILLPYVDKVCSRWTTFTVNSLSVHRFVIAGVSVGSKALSDSFCTNGRYARVGGVSLAEMCLLEKEFCEAIDWRLTTTGAVLAHYYTSLVRSHPSYRLPPGEIPIPSNIHPLDHVAISLDSLPSSTNSSKRSSMNVTDTDVDGDADMEDEGDSGPIPNANVNGGTSIMMEVQSTPIHHTPQSLTASSTHIHSPSHPYSHTSTSHPDLNNNSNGFSHKGKSTTAITPPQDAIYNHHVDSPITISSNYFPPPPPPTTNSKSIPILEATSTSPLPLASSTFPTLSTAVIHNPISLMERSRSQGPALIPPKNLSSNRLVTASNLPSPVRTGGRSLSDGTIEDSIDNVNDLGREVKRRLLDKTSSPTTSFRNGSGGSTGSSRSSLSSPNSTGISPRIVQLGRDVDGEGGIVGIDEVLS